MEKKLSYVEPKMVVVELNEKTAVLTSLPGCPNYSNDGPGAGLPVCCNS